MPDPGAIQARGGWPLGQVGPDSEGGWGCRLWIGWFASETCVFQGAVCFLKESVNPAGGGEGGQSFLHHPDSKISKHQAYRIKKT